MHIISGADGCKAGWVVVSKDLDSGAISWCLCRDAQALIHGEPAPDVLAIDVPIGLPDIGARECDKAARQLLGPQRGSSVFSAPLRPMLAAETYVEASRIRFGIEQKKMSIQAWGIVPKIREVDAILGRDARLQARVHEVHPEVSFCFLGGQQQRPQFSKKKREGREERIRLLEPVFGQAVRQALATKRELASQEDDILDAFVALWTAGRILSGSARTLPAEPAKDSRGLRMEIVY